jgi:hypothetical protein
MQMLRFLLLANFIVQHEERNLVMTLLSWLPFIHAADMFFTLAAGEAGLLILAFSRNL